MEKRVLNLIDTNKNLNLEVKKLKNENNELIKQAEEERNNKENILTKLNMLKEVFY